jgi:hypothetical protein
MCRASSTVLECPLLKDCTAATTNVMNEGSGPVVTARCGRRKALKSMADSRPHLGHSSARLSTLEPTVSSKPTEKADANPKIFRSFSVLRFFLP